MRIPKNPILSLLLIGLAMLVSGCDSAESGPVSPSPAEEGHFAGGVPDDVLRSLVRDLNSQVNRDAQLGFLVVKISLFSMQAGKRADRVQKAVAEAISYDCPPDESEICTFRFLKE